MLLGALQFAAHRLSTSSSDGGSLSVLLFGEQLLRRDAAGAWQLLHIQLKPGATKDAAVQPIPLPVTAAAAESATVLVQAQDDYPPGGYAEMVRRALACLQVKTLVSLTLSQSYRRRVQIPATQAFERLRAANPAPASFFVNDGTDLRLFGASPDLQLVIESGMIQSLLVCGTVARRPGAIGESESLVSCSMKRSTLPHSRYAPTRCVTTSRRCASQGPCTCAIGATRCRWPLWCIQSTAWKDDCALARMPGMPSLPQPRLQW